MSKTEIFTINKDLISDVTELTNFNLWALEYNNFLSFFYEKKERNNKLSKSFLNTF